MSQFNQAPVTANKTKNRLQIGCTALFLNLLFAGFCMWGVFAAQTSWKLQTEGVTTTGTVASMKETSDADGSCCAYSPVVEFEANGQTYTIEGDNATSPPAYRVGQQVDVLYDPSNPQTAQINNFFERWLFPILIIPAMILTALTVNAVMAFAFWRGSSLGNSE